MAVFKHGDSKKRLYKCWQGMKDRCGHKWAYKWYGSKGISICEEWIDYLSFREWALRNGYSDKLTLDRIDNSRGYYPSNCRWIEKAEQSKNRDYNHRIFFKDKFLLLSEWATLLGVKRSTLAQRYYVYKWELDKVFKEGRKTLWQS